MCTHALFAVSRSCSNGKLDIDAFSLRVYLMSYTLTVDKVWRINVRMSDCLCKLKYCTTVTDSRREVLRLNYTDFRVWRGRASDIDEFKSVACAGDSDWW